MRTPKQLYPNERIIYKPELSYCIHCGEPLRMCNYLIWDKTVQTLNSVLSVASRPGFCADSQCSGHSMRLVSAEGQQIAPAGFSYGYDVLARIGWLRQERQDTYTEIQTELADQVQISQSHVRYLYQQVYLPLLACRERQYQACLAQAARQHGGLIIALDGLAPEGGEPQLWFIRELLTDLTLRSGWLSRFDQATFEAFLEPVAKLDWPILAVLSDKQKGLPEAIASVLPNSRHHFCHAHYLNNLADPLAQADSSFKVALRQSVRAEVGLLIRAENLSPEPQPAVLTVTGLLPAPSPPSADPQSSGIESEPSPPPSDKAVADAIVRQLLRHTRYLLTLKGRLPFRLAGIEIYQRLQAVASLSQELLAHRYDARLAHLCAGLQTALAPLASENYELNQAETWLRDIDAILDPDDPSAVTGQQVARQLRAYLDDLLTLTDLPSRLDAFRQHLDKVSTNYWPGLFHCYDIEELPRTNNNLESHFRDTQRRLLRTTGQKGLTRRTLQRTGAWELLPRPPTETRCLLALREVPMDQLALERDRLRQHQDRFRLHTRSIQRITSQFDKLRRQWLALAATSTG